MDTSIVTREKIIKNYLAGYNACNINQMTLDLDEQVVFENIQNNKITLALTGLAAFKQQAEKAKTYFKQRAQTIKSFNHNGNQTEIEIDYRAILAQDFPNGLKSGQELQLTGKSIFQFWNNRIIKITDISE